MYIVLQDATGHAAGHMYLHEKGASLYLRQGFYGEGVLLSQKGEQWGLDSPCPFAPVGGVVIQGETILCRGIAPGQTLSLQGLEALYLHPPKPQPQEAEKIEPTDKIEIKTEEASAIKEKPEPAIEAELVGEKPVQAGVEEAQTAAVVFAAVAEEAGRVFRELEGTPLPNYDSPRGAERWMQNTDALLRGITKKPPAEKPEAGNPVLNPFPHAFPGAKLYRVRGRGVLEHLEGEWRQGTRRYKLTAVPGAPALRPPRHLQGFTRYVSTGQGGYWIKLSPLF